MRIGLADFVDFQRHKVTTDLVLPAAGRGLERLESGWLPRGGEEGSPAHLEMGSHLASLSFFSLGGDTRTLEIEAELVPRTSEGRVRLGLAVNEGDELEYKMLRPGRQIYRFDMPDGTVRTGENAVHLRLRPRGARASRRRPSSVRIHRIAYLSESPRPPRQSTPEEIRLEIARKRSGLRRTIEMPTSSRLDAVTVLPGAPRLVGRLVIDLPPGSGQGAVDLEIDLLDESGATRPLYSRLGIDRDLRERLRIDLSPWEGRLVRIRVSFAGGVNALLRLEDARIEGAPGTMPPASAEPLVPVAPERSRRLGRPDVLLVILDAARADAFSCYGAAEPTPAVDRLASEGTRFARARAASAWTGQSVPALFTGLYPDTVGIDHWGSRLPEQAVTLAQLFAASGYRTVLWTQHPFYRGSRELQKGFDRVVFGRKKDFQHLPEPAELLDGDGPLFAVVHLLPPHTPYAPPAPFRGAYTSWYEGTVELEPKFLNSFPRSRDPATLDADSRRYIRGRYQENVAFADSLLARVIRIFEDAGRYDPSLVALVSDHGEAFLEHDRFLHGKQLHNEFVHVPLIVKWPAAVTNFAAVVEEPVSLVDLAPTLVDGIGLGEALGFQGRSLLPAALDGRPARWPIYAYTRGVADGTKPPRPQRMMEAGGWKIVLDQRARTEYLYRSAEDPEEQEDLASRYPLRALLLRQAALRQAALNTRIGGSLGSLEDRELDPETMERLRALGYLQ